MITRLTESLPSIRSSPYPSSCDCSPPGRSPRRRRPTLLQPSSQHELHRRPPHPIRRRSLPLFRLPDGKDVAHADRLQRPSRDQRLRPRRHLPKALTGPRSPTPNRRPIALHLALRRVARVRGGDAEGCAGRGQAGGEDGEGLDAHWKEASGNLRGVLAAGSEDEQFQEECGRGHPGKLTLIEHWRVVGHANTLW